VVERSGADGDDQDVEVVSRSARLTFDRQGAATFELRRT
jgi:hypothetical protein